MRVELHMVLDDLSGLGNRLRRRHVHGVELLPGLVIHRLPDKPWRDAPCCYSLTHRRSGMGLGFRFMCPRNRQRVGEMRELIRAAGVDWTRPVDEILSTSGDRLKEAGKRWQASLRAT